MNQDQNTASGIKDPALAFFGAAAARFKLLTPEREFELATRWQKNGDHDALHGLINPHLRYVVKIAAGYRGYGLPMDELVGEGCVGLIVGARKFDPDKGFRLATYSLWWIRAAITQFVLNNWSMVKLATTQEHKKLFFKLKQAKRKLGIPDDRDLMPAEAERIARSMGIGRSEVVVEMSRRLAGDMSLNAPARANEEDSGEFIDFLADHGALPDEIVIESDERARRSEHLKNAMHGVLNDRERTIINARMLEDDPVTLEDLAAQFGVSRERIRQIEAKAFDKVSRHVLAAERAVQGAVNELMQ